MNIFVRWVNDKRFTKGLAKLSIGAYSLSWIGAVYMNLDNVENSKNKIYQIQHQNTLQSIRKVENEISKIQNNKDCYILPVLVGTTSSNLAITKLTRLDI